MIKPGGDDCFVPNVIKGPRDVAIKVSGLLVRLRDCPPLSGTVLARLHRLPPALSLRKRRLSLSGRRWNDLQGAPSDRNILLCNLLTVWASCCACDPAGPRVDLRGHGRRYLPK